jgi:hypothetical protein
MFLIAKLVTDGYRAQTETKKRLQTQKNGRNWNLENVGFWVRKYMLCFSKNYWIKQNKIRLHQDKDPIFLN